LRVGFNGTSVNYYDADTQIFRNIAGTERARIDSSGRLLVGTSTSLGKFFNNASTIDHRIQGESTTPWSQSWVTHGGTSAASGSYLTVGRSRGTTAGSVTVVASGDLIGSLNFQGADGSEFVEAANIKAEVDGTPGADDMPGRLVFSTTPSGSATPTERARLTNTGALLVGTTATPTGAGIGAVVAHNRIVINSINSGRFQIIAGDIGTVTATTGTVVFKFKGVATSPRVALVKLAVNQRTNSNTQIGRAHV
jgi:hypothetical protein